MRWRINRNAVAVREARGSAPLACRWWRSAARTSTSISAVGTRPIEPAPWTLLCSSAWET